MYREAIDQIPLYLSYTLYTGLFLNNLSSKLLNCFVFKTLCSKTKQLRSLLN